jgi:hypothetical protein
MYLQYMINIKLGSLHSTVRESDVTALQSQIELCIEGFA